MLDPELLDFALKRSRDVSLLVLDGVFHRHLVGVFLLSLHQFVLLVQVAL